MDLMAMKTKCLVHQLELCSPDFFRKTFYGCQIDYANESYLTSLFKTVLPCPALRFVMPAGSTLLLEF